MDERRWRAPVGNQTRAVRLGAALVVVCLALSPVSRIALGPSFPLFAMILAGSIMGMFITGLLLVMQARALPALPPPTLGAGFIFASAVLVPYALLYHGMFPGLGAAIGAAPNAHEYLWFFWQVGLLLTIIASQRLRPSDDGSDAGRTQNGRRAIVALIVAYFVGTPLAIWMPGLPSTFEHDAWTPLYSLLMVPVIAVCGLVAVIEAFRPLKRSNVLDAWIGIVALGVLAQTYLTVIGGSRFTLGWYGSRLAMLVTTTVVLGVLIGQSSRLYAELVARAGELDDEARTDTLTGLPNRRRFDEEFARAFGSAVRRSSAISVALIDIDRFKQFNDSFGHQAGDVTLHRIAQTIAESVARSGDFAARYGGEEFVVILADTTLAGATAVAERIRRAVLESGIRNASGEPLTVSVGVAARLPGGAADVLLGQADEALYQAKNAGRNCVVAWTSPDVAPVGSAYEDATLAE